MKISIGLYVQKCMVCQQVKAEHQKPAGLLNPLDIPEWKWKNIIIDFVVGFPKSARGNNAIWVVVDRLTKSTHFLPVKMTFSLDQLAQLYIKEVVRLHDVPVSIVSDKDPRFTSKFWKKSTRSYGNEAEL